ncbi:MAG: glycosyltransferase [Thermodesulfobacteriota bacterium]|nr:glycosyltransferase [Thermodesulfobacteriota bacterium]
MKLLYIHNTPIDSEKANLVQVVQMCHAFANNGVDLVLALPSSSKSEIVHDDQKENFCNEFGVDMNFDIVTYPKITLFGKLKKIGGYFGVKRLLENSVTDICFLRNVSYIDLVMSNNFPVVFECHEAKLHHQPLLNLFWTHRLVKNSTDKRFLKFIAISEALALFWREKNIPASKIIISHDGFNHLQFAEPMEKTTCRIKLNLPTKRKIVMYLGSLYRDRGIKNILKLAKIFDDVLFVVVGGPDNEKDKLKDISRKEDLVNIIFTGRISHNKVKDYLFSADVLLMVWTDQVKTIHICSPLKMFEYMAAGRIIVGHGYPTIKEVLTDGETALLAPPGDFTKLKEKLQSALDDHSCEKLAVQARESAFSKYSWDLRAKYILDHLSSSSNDWPSA